MASLRRLIGSCSLTPNTSLDFILFCELFRLLLFVSNSAATLLLSCIEGLICAYSDLQGYITANGRRIY